MDKKLYTVKEVCEKYSVTRKTLFYYDRINLIKPYSRQGVQQHKMYTEDELKLLDRVLLLRKCGLRIAEIVDFVRNSDSARQKALLLKVLERLQKEMSDKASRIDSLKGFIAELN